MIEQGIKDFHYMNLYKNIAEQMRNRFSKNKNVNITLEKEDEFLEKEIGETHRNLIVHLKEGLRLELVANPYREERESRYFTVALTFVLGNIANLMVDFYVDNNLNQYIVIHRIKFYPDVLFGNISYEKGKVSKEDMNFVLNKMFTTFENMINNRDKLLSLLLQDAKLISKDKELEFIEEFVPIRWKTYKFRFAIDKETKSVYVDGIFSESYKSSTNAIEYIAEYVRQKFFPNITLDKVNIYNIVDWLGGFWSISKINFIPEFIERGWIIKKKEIVDYNIDFQPIYVLDGDRKIEILRDILN